MLDPYRYDTAKFRANGVASREDNNSFGELQLDAGKSVVVVTRPVENGNGNLVQTGCSITGRLHYTTTPGNWSNSVTVTGIFHPAGLSNKPIFDYYTFDLGPSPPVPRSNSGWKPSTPPAPPMPKTPATTSISPSPERPGTPTWTACRTNGKWTLSET